MKEIRIGMIGTGMAGIEHIRRIHKDLSGGYIYAVASATLELAREAADQYRIEHIMEAKELIACPEVDAVVIASSVVTHEEYVLDCIAHDKPVFCEKPLAPTVDGCQRIIEAECAKGKRMVQVGFMRHFDQHHNELRRLVKSGELGKPLMVHAVHRNPTVGAHYDDKLEIVDAAVHEIDVLPWLLGDDPLVACRVLYGASTAAVDGKLHDPQLVLLETKSGVLIDLEVFTHCQYGYDIGVELVCEQGTAALPGSASAIVKQGYSRRVREYDYWQERYWHSFDKELQVFMDSVHDGRITGPSSWDGYAAAVVGDACILAQQTGKRQAITYMEMPAIYQE